MLLDCAHNVASAQALVSALRTSFPLPSPTAMRTLIFAGSQDKDLAGMLNLLAPLFDRIYLTSFRNMALRRRSNWQLWSRPTNSLPASSVPAHPQRGGVPAAKQGRTI